MNRIGWLIGVLLMCFCAMPLCAQRSLDLHNISQLTISRQSDLEKHPLVSVEKVQGNLRLVAKAGLKFVQIRNTAEFILLPTTYSAKTVDVAALIEKPYNGMRLDPRRPAMRVISRHRVKETPLVPERCGKDCLILGEARVVDILGVGLKPGEAIILPHYTTK